jgi:hypothetical protein
MFIEPAAI